MRTQQPATATTIVTPPTHPAYQTPAMTTPSADATPADNDSNSLVRLNSVGLLIGTNLVKPQDANLLSTFAVGARAYMPISNTNLDFIPELFVGFGKKTTIGVSGNVAYNFNFKELGDFVPYLGAGIGWFTAVSYTHLDVYKRQATACSMRAVTSICARRYLTERPGIGSSSRKDWEAKPSRR